MMAIPDKVQNRPPGKSPSARLGGVDMTAALAGQSELERMREENLHLRDLVVQLSRLVVENAVARK